MQLLGTQVIKKTYTFDNYVESHQSAHNTLAVLLEGVPETKKVTDFLAGISDPRLSNAKDLISTIHKQIRPMVRGSRVAVNPANRKEGVKEKGRTMVPAMNLKSRPGSILGQSGSSLHPNKEPKLKK